MSAQLVSGWAGTGSATASHTATSATGGAQPSARRAQSTCGRADRRGCPRYSGRGRARMANQAFCATIRGSHSGPRAEPSPGPSPGHTSSAIRRRCGIVMGERPGRTCQRGWG